MEESLIEIAAPTPTEAWLEEHTMSIPQRIFKQIEREKAAGIYIKPVFHGAHGVSKPLPELTPDTAAAVRELTDEVRELTDELARNRAHAVRDMLIVSGLTLIVLLIVAGISFHMGWVH